MSWAAALSDACARHGLRGTARLLGVSPALVSLTLAGRRKRTDFIRERVESRLMTANVFCPVLGGMGRAACLKEQAKPLVTCNPLSVQLYRACRAGCGHFENQTKENPDVR
jgi:hypothetical protein